MSTLYHTSLEVLEYQFAEHVIMCYLVLYQVPGTTMCSWYQWRWEYYITPYKNDKYMYQ
jgi:hypothetical protein